MRKTRRMKKLPKLDLEIRKLIYSHKIRHGVEINQSGGARCRVRQGTIIQDGFRYKYTCREEDESTLVIQGGSSRRPCFGVFINPDHKTAELHDLVRTSDCSLDPGFTMKAAALAAFQIAREYGIHQIQLTDNSTKTLPSKKKFKISLMKFLTTGQTWYESFLPVRPHPAYVERIERWRNTVHTNTWADVYSCLRTIKPDTVIPADISDIDSTLPGSAMVVFQRISLLQNNNLQQLANPCGSPQGAKEANTDFFADYDGYLCTCSKIETTYGTEWIADV